MSDSIKRDTEEGSHAQGLSTPATGHKLRRGLLIANVTLLLVSSLLSSQIDSRFGLDPSVTVRIAMASFLMMCYLAPLMLATVLAAWGPWRPWIRGALYLLTVVVAVGMKQVFALNLARIQHASGLMVAETLNELSEWFVVMVPAIFTLVLVGSWLRVRIGPPGLPPVRLSILSVMIATAVLGIVMSASIAANEFLLGDFFTDGHSSARLERKRVQVLMQAAVAGPIVGLVLALVVASAFRWWARFLLVVLLGVYGGLMIYFAMQSAPQFPGNPPNILFVIYGGMLAGVLILLASVIVCIRLLARSGWPCSRRNLKPTVMP